MLVEVCHGKTKIIMTGIQRKSVLQLTNGQVKNIIATSTATSTGWAIGHDFLCTLCDYKEHDHKLFSKETKGR